MGSSGLITFTTDFGMSDNYVGVMKGVIYGINPAASVVDISHQVSPQDVRQGAFVLGSSVKFFPKDAIHVGVVDPGVGSSRDALALSGPAGYFVGPDNGMFSLAAGENSEIETPGKHRLPQGWRAYRITNPKYMLTPVSATFHGRDVFAPVAAHLSLGVAPDDLGPEVAEIIRLPFPGPLKQDAGLRGQVVYVDRFGNMVTNIREKDLAGWLQVRVEVCGRVIDKLSRSYADGGRLAALIGSAGYLEVAVKNGSAAEELKAGVGTPVTVGAST